uniref:MAM domain containing glycosylphosphatidylinositol anchor 2a n=2 Tax=Neolamprologus brichardi TaxID=32507 RepID=A0A3Q4HYY5_NEOBR
VIMTGGAPPTVRIVHSGQACNVEEERYSERVYTIKEGETLELQCLVTGHPRPQIRWTKTAGGASDRESSLHNETLRIQNINRHQGGRYYCKAENGLGSPAIRSIRVDVYCKNPDSHQPDILEQTHGSDSGVEIYEPFFTQGETKILKLKNLRPQDYADYTCFSSVRNVCGIEDKSAHFALSNRTGTQNPQTSSTAQRSAVVLSVVTWHTSRTRMCLCVCPLLHLLCPHMFVCLCPLCHVGLRKGRFWITPDPYHNDDNIQIGREVKISCQVEATPPEELQFGWLKNGRPLRSSERMVITHTDTDVSPGTTNLDIIDLKFTDFGTYTCVASLRNGGTPEISIDVNISSTTVPPELTVPRGRSHLIAQEGDTVDLQCLVSGKPKPIILWSRVEESGAAAAAAALMPDGSVQTESYDGILRISNVSREMSGTYRCQTSQYNGFNVKPREALIQLVVQCGSAASKDSCRFLSESADYTEQIKCSRFSNVVPNSFTGWTGSVRDVFSGADNRRLSCVSDIRYVSDSAPHTKVTQVGFENIGFVPFTQSHHDRIDGSQRVREVGFDTSRPRLEDDTARLLSPTFNSKSSSVSNNPTYCFAFYYHMYGKHIGALNVFLRQKGQAVTDTLVWSLTGNQGDRWRQAKVKIHPTTAFQMVIEGVRGSGIEGDIAIDDVAIEEGECKDPPPNSEYALDEKLLFDSWLLQTHTQVLSETSRT